MRFLALLALAFLLALPAHATNVSTADPTYPEAFEDIDAEPLRDQFNKLINDVDNLWAAQGPNLLEANQLFGALEDGKALPISMPSCFGVDNALTWRPGLGFGCNEFTGSGGSVQFSDLIGNIGVSQMASGTGASSVTYFDGTGHWTTPSTAAIIPVTTIASSGTSRTIAFPASGSIVYDVTLTGNCVFTLSGGTAGQMQSITLILRQDGTAGRNSTLPTGVKWSGGAVPVPNTLAGKIDVLTFRTPDAGVTVFGSLL